MFSYAGEGPESAEMVLQSCEVLIFVYIYIARCIYIYRGAVCVLCCNCYKVEANFEFLAGFYATFAGVGVPKHAMIKADSKSRSDKIKRYIL